VMTNDDEWCVVCLQRKIICSSSAVIQIQKERKKQAQKCPANV